jgi:hypothetical protein
MTVSMGLLSVRSHEDRGLLRYERSQRHVRRGVFAELSGLITSMELSGMSIHAPQPRAPAADTFIKACEG